MNKRKVGILTPILALTFVVVTATAATVGAHQSRQSTALASRPLSGHQLQQIPEFQPSPSSGQPSISYGDIVGLGSSLNGWKYKVSYKYTTQG